MDSLGLYDIYDYWYVPFWQTTFFKVIIILSIAFICCIFIFFIIKVIIKKRSLDVWVSWNNTLDNIRHKKVTDKKFYEIVTQLLKEVAITTLDAPKGYTDIELSSFLKNEQFPQEIQSLGSIVDKAALYKFDPIHENNIQYNTDLEHITKALVAIKKWLSIRKI